MSVKIIVDSTANMSEIVQKRLHTVPLTVHFGEEGYLDGVEINNRQFYERLIESDVLPTTSQATPQVFVDAFEEVLGEGDTAVVITLGSSLSGTYNSAAIAAQDYEGRVFVVDSETVTIGAGILIQYALQLVDRGMSAAEIAQELEQAKKRVAIIALLDTLEYLKRGGRISKTVAFAGGLLAIKPVITLEGGNISVLGKARGSRQGNNLLNEEIRKVGGVDFERPVLLGYTGLNDDLLQKYVDDSRGLWEGNVERPESCCIGSVVGTHVGPGAIAVAFFKKA